MLDKNFLNEIFNGIGNCYFYPINFFILFWLLYNTTDIDMDFDIYLLQQELLVSTTQSGFSVNIYDQLRECFYKNTVHGNNVLIQ